VRKAASLAAALAALLVVLPLQAQLLYKWIDADGKTQYSDHLPKNYKGPVTIIEQDIAPTPTPRAPAPAAVAPKKAPVVKVDREPDAAPDRATQRRTTRDALGLRLEQARQNLANAQKALEDAASPEPDERQVVRQVQQAGQGGMMGYSKDRSNCSQIIRDGKVVGVMCPAIVPNEAYFDRIAKLEAAVKQAEEEVNAAEQAYRRGVD
jgi:hypothetical protein